MDSNCLQNVCCAQCILSHTSHKSIEIEACLRDLKVFRKTIKNCNEEIMSEKLLLKKQILKELDEEIDHICREFHHNIQFMKK